MSKTFAPAKVQLFFDICKFICKKRAKLSYRCTVYMATTTGALYPVYSRSIPGLFSWAV